jgi:hypothetical protein
MRPETRRLAIGGLITLGICCVAAGIHSVMYSPDNVPIWIGVVNTVVVGIVGLLKAGKED